MKRYVLTKDKEIRLSNEYYDYDANIDKTSDNLLDLAEVGDCVEIDNDTTIQIVSIDFTTSQDIAKYIVYSKHEKKYIW